MQAKATGRLLRRDRGLSMAILLATAAVAALHAGILWQRLADHSIANRGVLTRWALALVMVLGALLLRRLAPSSGRGWLVFWLAVAVLHLAGPLGADEPGRMAALVEAMLTAAPLLIVFLMMDVGATWRPAASMAIRTGTGTRRGFAAHTRGRAPPRR